MSDHNARMTILEGLESLYCSDNPAAWEPIKYSSRGIANDPEALRQHLIQRLSDSQIGYHLQAGRSELLDAMANRIYAAKTAQVVIAEGGTLRIRHGLQERLPEVRLDVAADIDPRSLQPSVVGITEGVALIAETGSVIVQSKDRRDFAASLLPGVHYCVVLEEAVFPDLEAWIRSSYRPDYHYVIVGGPSRTADIEKKVVVGVHGPWRVSLFILRRGWESQ